MDGILDFLTSKTGIVAAVAAVLAILVALQTLMKPWREKRAARPMLTLTNPVVSDLAPYGRARDIRFQVVNSGSGSALLTALKLQVTAHRQTKRARATVTSAPVTVHQHRVELIVGCEEYDVRARAFGPKQPPLTYGDKETEAFVVRLVSREPHWYRARITAEWSDLSSPHDVRTATTQEFDLDFPVEPSDPTEQRGAETRTDPTR